MRHANRLISETINSRSEHLSFIVSHSEESSFVSIRVKIVTRDDYKPQRTVQGSIAIDLHSDRIQLFSPQALLPEIQLFLCISTELIPLIKSLLKSNKSKAQIITALYNQLGTLPIGAVQCLNNYLTNIII